MPQPQRVLLRRHGQAGCPGEVIAERIHRNDSATFISFLSMLSQMIPPHLRIHLIMDNGSSHTSRATRAWLDANPRFAVTCTPSTRPGST